LETTTFLELEDSANIFPTPRKSVDLQPRLMWARRLRLATEVDEQKGQRRGCHAWNSSSLSDRTGAMVAELLDGLSRQPADAVERHLGWDAPVVPRVQPAAKRPLMLRDVAFVLELGLDLVLHVPWKTGSGGVLGRQAQVRDAR